MKKGGINRYDLSMNALYNRRLIWVEHDNLGLARCALGGSVYKSQHNVIGCGPRKKVELQALIGRKDNDGMYLN